MVCLIELEIIYIYNNNKYLFFFCAHIEQELTERNKQVISRIAESLKKTKKALKRRRKGVIYILVFFLEHIPELFRVHVYYNAFFFIC